MKMTIEGHPFRTWLSNNWQWPTVLTLMSLAIWGALPFILASCQKDKRPPHTNHNLKTWYHDGLCFVARTYGSDSPFVQVNCESLDSWKKINGQDCPLGEIEWTEFYPLRGGQWLK